MRACREGGLASAHLLHSHFYGIIGRRECPLSRISQTPEPKITITVSHESLLAIEDGFITRDEESFEEGRDEVALDLPGGVSCRCSVVIVLVLQRWLIALAKPWGGGSLLAKFQFSSVAGRHRRNGGVSVSLHSLLESTHLLDLVELPAHLHIHLQSLLSFNSKVLQQLVLLLFHMLDFFFQVIDLFVL